jgi:hypothetical protein
LRRLRPKHVTRPAIEEAIGVGLWKADVVLQAKEVLGILRKHVTDEMEPLRAG